MDKFKNKYRIPSARLQSWDYANNGAYFITICTKKRYCLFGDVKDGKMQLNEIGQLAEKYWMEIPNHFSFIELGNFVVMPNHTHGILIINKTNDILGDSGAVEINNKTIGQMRFQNQGKNTISSIVGSYKSVVSKHSRLIHADFAWQPRFHDHIIRDTQSFENIQNYIAINPMKWGKDKFYDE